MLQTVFRIPHQVAGLPVFGWGWALAALALVAVALALLALVRPPQRREIASFVPTLLLLAAAAMWVMPFLEERGLDNQPAGLPIRGYGVMLLAGVVCGFALTVHRARGMGFNPDRALAMCIWMFVAGILGARLFHVVQYWHVFRDPDSFLKSLINALKFNEGGLVVYGSLVGGLLAVVVFCRREGWSLLKAGDMVAPGMLLGLALGRIGCLLNGCCHGGVCHDQSFAVTFPQGTHPYMKQLESGELLGIRLDGARVAEVGDGIAVGRGVRAGDRVLRMPLDKELISGRGGELLVIQRREGHNASWTARQLPRRSLPTKPTQIYSSINAALLCLLLVAWHPYRRHDGELIVLLLTLYPLTRFLLELVRTDEPGRFGTALTISQWVSIGMLIVAAVLWWFVSRQRRRTPRASPA